MYVRFLWVSYNTQFAKKKERRKSQQNAAI